MYFSHIFFFFLFTFLKIHKGVSRPCAILIVDVLSVGGCDLFAWCVYIYIYYHTVINNKSGYAMECALVWWFMVQLGLTGL